MGIKINGIKKSFDSLKVIENMSFEIGDNKITAILGPSGCGKTTLLNIISGVIKPEEGSVEGLNKRRISYLFQEDRLLPWKTVYGNIDLILKSMYPAAERQGIINHFLELVGLIDFRDYYPDGLSGGMRQRAAIARAFAYPAEIILMDEPFQALDLRLKLNLLNSFNRVWMEDSRTAVFVTHDIQEAVLLGDEIFVFSDRPAEIENKIGNNVPHSERSLRNSEVIEMVSELYALLGRER